MIVDRVLGNLADLSPSERQGLHVEKVVLPSSDLVKRIQRVTTDHGRTLGLRLDSPRGAAGDLQDGDILHVLARTLDLVEVERILTHAPEQED